MFSLILRTSTTSIHGEWPISVSVSLCNMQVLLKKEKNVLPKGINGNLPEKPYAFENECHQLECENTYIINLQVTKFKLIV